MALIVLGVGISGFQFSGYLVNHVDIAPRYAGLLMGVSNCLACFSGFVGPVMVQVVTKDVSTARATLTSDCTRMLKIYFNYFTPIYLALY